MSAHDAETVRKVAHLARLEITPAEADVLGAQFASILAAFRVLGQVDVEGVEPAAIAAPGPGVLRDDLPRPSLEADELLERAPAREDGFFSVPKTVGGEA